MEEEIQRYRESKLMEPIYRMYKVIAEKDELKAQTFLAVVVQYFLDNMKNMQVKPTDIQNIIRAVLLNDEDGTYYGMYAFNEIQVKTAEWITILSADLPITLDNLGAISDNIGKVLENRVCVQLSAYDVVELMEQSVAPFNGELLSRIQLNKEVYIRDLESFLAVTSSKQN